MICERPTARCLSGAPTEKPLQTWTPPTVGKMHITHSLVIHVVIIHAAIVLFFARFFFAVICSADFMAISFIWVCQFYVAFNGLFAARPFPIQVNFRRLFMSRVQFRNDVRPPFSFVMIEATIMAHITNSNENVYAYIYL